MEILIVDDEPEVADVLAQSLRRQGHRTTVVHSGTDALKLLTTASPDAMFLDVSMPGMNGLDVMQQVKKLKPALAVVVITGHATADEVEDVRRLGAVDVVAADRTLDPEPLRRVHLRLQHEPHRAGQRLDGTQPRLEQHCDARHVVSTYRVHDGARVRLLQRLALQ